LDVTEAAEALHTSVKDAMLGDLRKDGPPGSELLESALKYEVNWQEICNLLRLSSILKEKN
jgi:hypothetical protein